MSKICLVHYCNFTNVAKKLILFKLCLVSFYGHHFTLLLGVVITGNFNIKLTNTPSLTAWGVLV